MKLSINGIKEQEAWKKAGIALPGYDVEAASEKAKENPVWVHYRKYFPRIYRWNCRWSSGRGSSGSWDYLCGNL